MDSYALVGYGKTSNVFDMCYRIYPRWRIHMIKLIVRLTAFWFVVFAVETPLFAQEESWNSLRSLKPGSKLRITLSDGRDVDARLQSWSAESLTVLRKEAVEAIPRLDVERVVLVSGKPARARAGWLALIGGASAGGTFGAVCGIRDNCGVSPGLLAASVSIIATLGAAYGTDALALRREEVMYKNRHKAAVSVLPLRVTSDTVP